MDYLTKAREFLESIVDEADTRGEHYAPCFRDCLADNLDWVAERLGGFLVEQEQRGK